MAAKRLSVQNPSGSLSHVSTSRPPVSTSTMLSTFGAGNLAGQLTLAVERLP